MFTSECGSQQGGRGEREREVVNHYFQLFVTETTFDNADVDWETLNQMGLDACREYVYQGEYRKRASYKQLKSQWLMQKDKPYHASANLLQAFAEFYNPELDTDSRSLRASVSSSACGDASSSAKVIKAEGAEVEDATPERVRSGVLSFPSPMEDVEVDVEGDEQARSRRESIGAQSAISTANIEKTPKTPASSSGAGSVSGRRRLREFSLRRR